MKSVRAISIALWALAALSGCGISCENEASTSIASPSGKYKAVVFNRNCGATTGANTQVSIVEAARSLPNGVGNVLIVDDSIALKIQWLGDGMLSIAGAHSPTVFKQESSTLGVAIVYE